MSTKACLNGPTELSTMVSRSTNHYFLCSCCFISEYYKEQYLLLLNSTITVYEVKLSCALHNAMQTGASFRDNSFV